MIQHGSIEFQSTSDIDARYSNAKSIPVDNPWKNG